MKFQYKYQQLNFSIKFKSAIKQRSMNNEKILKLINSKDIYRASDKVKYCSWAIYLTTNIFEISLILAFLVFTILHDIQSDDAFSWLPLNDKKMILGGFAIMVWIFKFLELIEHEPSKVPKQFKTLLRQVVHLGIKLCLAFTFLYAIIDSLTLKFIGIFSSLSTISNTLILLKLSQACIHLILTKVSFKDMFIVFLATISTIICSPLILLEGFYSFFVKIWISQSLNDYVSKGEKLKRTVRIVELFVPLIFIVGQAFQSLFGVSSQISQGTWYLFLYMAISFALISVLQKIFTDINNATNDTNPKKISTSHFSLTIYCINTVVNFIITRKVFILKTKLCLTVLKAIILIIGYILLVVVVWKHDQFVLIISALVCVIATVIGLYFAYCDYKNNSRKFAIINQEELITSTIELGSNRQID